MGKLVIFLSCIVFFTILFPSTTLGDEQSQEVPDDFGREPRETGRKQGNMAREYKNSSGRKKSKKMGKKADTKKNSNAKNTRKSNRKKGGKSKKMSTSLFRKRKSKKQNKSNKNGCSNQTFNSCHYQKAFSLKDLYNQVNNFKKQLKRAKSQANLVGNKRKKRNNFQKYAEILTNVVGGNLDNPTCSAKSRSASSAGSLGLNLTNCNTTIATSCEIITINSTLTGTCLATMTTFENKVEECRESGTCVCWKEAFGMKGDIAKCSAKEEAKDVKAKKNTCLKTFGDCKKYQDRAVEYTATCPSKNSSTIAMSTATTANSTATTAKSTATTAKSTATTAKSTATTAKSTATTAMSTATTAMSTATTAMSTATTAKSTATTAKFTATTAMSTATTAMSTATTAMSTAITAKSKTTTAMSTATTTKSARRRNIVEKILARNLMRRSHHNAIRARPSRVTSS